MDARNLAILQGVYPIRTVVGAVLFGLAIIIIHNKYEKNCLTMYKSNSCLGVISDRFLI